MRPEEEVVGFERVEQQRGLLEQYQDEFEEGEARAFDEQVAEVRISGREHHDDVLTAMKSILEGQPLDLEELHLSEQERSALAAMRAAFIGKDARYNKFMFAEQRRELLEQALAALQPMLALDVSREPALRENYDMLVEEIAELREYLVSLEDAQDDEMLTQHGIGKGEESEQEDDDKGDGDKDDGKNDGKNDGDPKPSALSDGPEAPPLRTAPSTLSDGPSAPSVGGKASALSDGPEVEREAAKSTLLDEEASGEASGKGAGKGGVLSRIGRALGLGKSDDSGKG